MRVHVLQHVPFEGPAAIQTWAEEKHIPVEIHRADQGDLPELNADDLLIIMGGPMSVTDTDVFPWLEAEQKFIREALTRGIRSLGVCLGAQLMAHVLGADVRPNGQKEIGWFDVSLTDAGQAHPLLAGVPESFGAFHWHGDRFAIPDGAQCLASSAACDHQAFAWQDRALALQFHLESTPDSVALLTEHCASDLTDGRFVQQTHQMIARADEARAMHPICHRILENLIRV